MLPVLKPEFFTLGGAVLSGQLADTSEMDLRFGQLVLKRSGGQDYKMYLEDFGEGYVLVFKRKEIVSFFDGFKETTKFTNDMLGGADFITPVTREQEMKHFVSDVTEDRIRKRHRILETEEDVRDYLDKVDPFIEAYENGVYNRLAA
jgi:hypothetical protein